MATRDELMQALRRADAAGDTAAATAIARRIQSMAPATVAAPAPAPEVGPLVDRPEGAWEGLKHGFTTSAAKTIRGLGTMLLPKSLEGRAEEAGYLPSEQFINDMEAAGEGNVASTVGGVAGDVLATAMPAVKAYKAVGALVPVGKGLVKAAGRVLGGGAAAGGAGAATLGEDIGEGALAGAALSPVAVGAGKLIKAGAKGVDALTGGAAGRAAAELRNVFGDRTAAVVQALRNLRGEVPGEAPTAGRAASAAFPELKVLEEAAMKEPGIGHKLLSAQERNVAAREAALEPTAFPGRRFPGEEMSEAEALRRRVTQPLYERAAEDRILLNPELAEIVRGAEAQTAFGRGARSFEQAQSNLAAAGRPVPPGQLPPTVPPGGRRGTMQIRSNETGEIISTQPTTPFMPNFDTRSVRDLQRAKQYLDLQIQGLGRSGADNLRLKQLSEARNLLDQQLREQSGDYALASEMFRNLSAPQNQADVAQVLVSALKKGPKQFIEATEDAARTIKRADLSPRFEHLQDVMTPEQMATINALKRTAQREVGYGRLKADPDLVPEYLSVFDKLERATPGFLNNVATVTRSVLKQLGGRSDEQVRKVVSEAMLDPNRLANLLETLPVSQRNSLIRSINAIGTEVPAGAVSGYAGGND